jgi:hypothetical protein
MTEPRLQTPSQRARPASQSWTWFCGYCGTPHDKDEPPEPMARVCGKCSFGLLIEAPQPVAPDSREAFLIVDHELRLRAVGWRAEKLLNVQESFVVGNDLTELLVPIDCEENGGGVLTDAVFEAVGDGHMPVPAHLVVRGVANPGLLLRARIGRCGPARAALIVLQQQPARPRPA